MNSNQIFEKCHCCLLSLTSIDTALLKVRNDLLLAADAGMYSVLILLDLSSALVYVLFANRSFCYFWTCCLLTCSFLLWGPPGTILGLYIYCILYVLPQGKIMFSRITDIHCNADDIQTYVPKKSLVPLMYLLLCGALQKLTVRWVECATSDFKATNSQAFYYC